MCTWEKQLWGSKGIKIGQREKLNFNAVGTIDVQSLSHVWLLATPWIAACQASLPSPTPRAYSSSCPLSRWCHPTISSSVIPFASFLQSFPTLWSFPMSRFFTSGGQSIGSTASASVLPMNIQGWFPLGWTGWISLQSKGLSKVFSISCHRDFSWFHGSPQAG